MATMKVAKTSMQLAGMACATCHKEPPPPEAASGGGYLLTPGAVLSACGGCRRLRYCGRDCQKLDWTTHKAVCKCLQKVNALETSMGKSIAEATGEATFAWGGAEAHTLFRAGVVLMEKELGAYDRTVLEQQQLAFAKRCRNCFRTPAIVAGAEHSGVEDPMTVATDRFLHCPTCKLATCCSEQCWAEYAPLHRTNGSCESLTCLREHQNHFWTSIITNGEEEIAVWISQNREKSYKGLPALQKGNEVQRKAPAGGWEEYYAWRGAPPRARLPRGLWLHTTTALGKPLSILLALEQVMGKAALGAATKLTVHLMEASQGYDFAHARCYEEIMHVLPNLRELNVAFIGWINSQGWPGLDDVGQPLGYRPFETCPTCTKLKVKRNFAIRRGGYKDAIVKAGGHKGAAGGSAGAGGASSSYTPPAPVDTPDIVVAFNFPFNEVDRAPALRPSLRYILDQGWPLLLTAFAEDEAIMALNEVQRQAKEAGAAMAAAASGKAGGEGGAAPASAPAAAASGKAKVIVPPSPNPYGGMALRQDILSSPEEVAAAKAGLTAEEMSKRWAQGLSGQDEGSGVAARLPPTSLAMDQFYADSRWYVVVQGYEPEAPSPPGASA